MTRTYTVGIDLGGTNIKGGVCDEQGALVTTMSIDTHAALGPDHVIERMADLTGELITRAGLPRGRVIGVGVGAPGPMSHARGFVYSAPNLPGFVDIPLRDRMTKRLALPVTVENDANAAAFGEFVAGAGRSARTLVMLTLGTGIGGGIILDGRLWRGARDNAAEIGHMIVVPDGRPCPCGQRGCVERYASAGAIAERLREAIDAGEPSTLRGRVEAGGAFDARDVLAAREAGDALADRIWQEACFHLAQCAVTLQHVINPELIVFAGGLINAGDALMVPVRRHFDSLRWRIAPDAPELTLATLGADAGTIGAAMLAREIAGPPPATG